jgi:hypothetical protein
MIKDAIANLVPREASLRLFQFRDGQRFGVNVRFMMLLKNHRERLIPAAPTVSPHATPG